jgi:putative phage-type endonuclease
MYEILDVVPDSEQWREERRKSIGASEVPIILGLTPWADATKVSVYQSKLGVDREFDPVMSERGHALEPALENLIRRFRPDVPPLRPAFMARSGRYPWLHASLDRVADSLGIVLPVQLKSDFQPGADKRWADGVPLHVEAQLQAEMFVLDAPAGYAACMTAFGWHCHRVERDQEWMDDYLIPLMKVFWFDHVVPRHPPEVVSASEHAAVWDAVPGKAVELTELLHDALDERAVLLSDKAEHDKQAKELKAKADAIQAAVLTYAEDAKFITWNGQPMYEILRRGRRSVSIETVEEKHPEILADVVTTSQWTILQPPKKPKENVA